MRKTRITKWEKWAGGFIVVALVGFFGTLLAVAIQKGWFDPRVTYKTHVKNGEGLHIGTLVQMSGLKAGEVDDMELLSDGQIELTLSIHERFSNKIRNGSEVNLVRPFVIGERIVDISLGSPDEPIIPVGSQLPAAESVDLITLLSGKKLGETLASMTSMAGSLRELLEAVFDPQRTQNWISILDRIDPLVRNLNTMSVEVSRLSRQATRDERLGTFLGELSITTKQINQVIPQFQEEAPELAKDLKSLVSNLAQLTEQFKVLTPALAEIAPDLPRASKRAIEALDESVVLMKALQKTFFVRGSAKEVRQEEADNKKKSEERLPSSASPETENNR